MRFREFKRIKEAPISDFQPMGDWDYDHEDEWGDEYEEPWKQEKRKRSLIRNGNRKFTRAGAKPRMITS